MSNIRKSLAAITLVGALSASVMVMPMSSSAQSSTEVGLRAAKAASARYHSTSQALKAGYSGEHEPCVRSDDGAGAMGFHYVNGALAAGPSVDALRPEILLYLANEDGKRVLAGVEYLVFDDDGDVTTDDDRPSLFGQEFDGPMEGHAPGIPLHYDLHVWFWHDNPSGLFAPFNPALSC